MRMQLGSEEEMQQRLASMPVHHSMRGLFFNSVLDVVRLLEDESAVSHCLESTGGTRYLDFFSYPTSAYVRLLYTAQSGG
ncbi:TIGR02265 family protein [Archangium lansingense]|uniref:TIGR02265 family protein n=1 Tax=Archangium lansingense TaxID=2995310 RepID=UPI003B765D53